MAMAVLLLLVKRDFPARDLAELVALLRREPDRHDYGSAGNGSASHISVAQLLSLTRTKMTHVVYRGTAPAVTDLVAGTVALVGDTSTTALGHLQGGTVRALAVTSPERLPFLPDVPTVRESGIPELADYRMSTWNVLLAPAGTPEAITRRLHDETRAALADPAFVRRLADLGNVPMSPATQEGTREFLVAEQERWRRVLADAGVHARVTAATAAAPSREAPDDQETVPMPSTPLESHLFRDLFGTPGHARRLRRRGPARTATRGRGRARPRRGQARRDPGGGGGGDQRRREEGPPLRHGAA